MEIGFNVSATNVQSIVCGKNSFVDKWNSFVCGEEISGFSDTAVGIGKKINISNDCSFVWNPSPAVEGVG